ncbi:MAG TPA: membrane protein insertase YidC [Thermoanaerobaculia bacterium]|nr:membrane protein insertase YidC [Thermoanaerobaculia bacterium]
MEKRIFIAIVISIAFLWLWAAVAPQLFPELAKKPEPAKPAAQQQQQTTPPPPPAATDTATAAPSAAAPTLAAAPDTTEPVSAQLVQLSVVDTPEFHAVLSNRGAQLVSFKLKKYPEKGSTRPVDLVKAREPNRIDYPFSIQGRDAALTNRLNAALYAVTDTTDAKGQRAIVYRWSDGRITSTKTFRFTQQPYRFDFSVQIAPPVPYRVAVGPGIRTLRPEEVDSQVVITGNGVLESEGKFKVLQREKGGTESFPGIEYVGIEDNYFLTILRPSRGGEGVFHRASFAVPNSKQKRIDLYAAVNAPPDGTVAGEAFFGPKEAELLESYGLESALQFGWFGVIARFLLTALVWINQYTLNYGFAIVVLTIFIKIVLYPLQHKQNVSMKKMQRVQPKMEAIRNKYKKSRTDAEQRQKMNVEMMQLYQKEGINPMAGCLPLILQLPILWGFYNLLSRAIELRGAPFMLWIQDLSEKDPYYITPILMTATMFLQTWMMPATGDPMQRRIFLIMPLVFGFLFKDFPSGLVLYWLVQNILTILQMWIMNKWWKEHPTELQST